MKHLKLRKCVKRFLAVIMLMLLAANPVLASVNLAYGSGEISGEENESELLTDDTITDTLEQDDGFVREGDTEQRMDSSVSDKEILEESKVSYEQLELKELVTKDDIDNGKHIKRMYEEEEGLSHAVYLNEDGSRTAYYFMHPIKYKDSKGNVKDITLDLKEDAKGNYISAQSDIVATFPEKLDEGIFLEKSEDDILISMYPNKAKFSLENKFTLSQKGERTKASSDAVEYIYDENTSIEYQLTYAGIKENIIVDKYTGQTEYSFLINTNGLKLIEDERTLLLVDEKIMLKHWLGML